MVGEDVGNSGGDSVVLGVLAENALTVRKLKGRPVNVENGDMNPSGSSGDVCRTYKRRKRTKVVEEGKVPACHNTYKVC